MAEDKTLGAVHFYYERFARFSLVSLPHHASKTDYFFCSYGTGGTLKGVAGELRDKSPNTKVYVAEPDNAPLLYSGIKTEYGDESAGESSHQSQHLNGNSRSVS